MEWDENPTKNRNEDTEFKEVADCTFHEADSLVDNISENSLLPGESSENGDITFLDVADCTFRASESLLGIPDDQLIQRGGGEPDFDIRLLQERKLIPFGVKDVSYELTFNDRILNDNKRMVDMKNLLQEAFQKMIDRVKKDLHPGDIMRGGYLQ